MYVKVKSAVIEKYPYEVNQIRKENPNISLPAYIDDDLLQTFGVYRVEQTEIPSYDLLNYIHEEENPVLIDGVWKQSWVVREKTNEEKLYLKTKIIKTIVDQTQKRLDDFARTRNYDDIRSACTYATSKVDKFRIEAQYCVDVRDDTWLKLYQILAEVESGIRNPPLSFGEIEQELPALNWPNV